MKKVIRSLCAVTAAALLISAYSFCLTVGAANNTLTDRDGTVWELVNEVKSPNDVLTTSIYTNTLGKLAYTVSSGKDTVIELSSLGITLTDCDLSTGLKYNNDAAQNTVTDEYELLAAQSSACSDTCIESVMTFSKDKFTLTLTVRVYNDGTAYRYSVDGENGIAYISDESSSMNLPEDTTVYYHPLSNSYEAAYQTISSADFKKAGISCLMPLLTKSKVNSTDYWAFFTESNIFSDEQVYSASRLRTNYGKSGFHYIKGNNQDNDIEMQYPFNTPWRVALIGTDIDTVANSSVVTSLNPDNKIGDTSWITPGKAAWSWWTTGDPISKSEQYEYIDFAAANGFEYSLIDYGWYLWNDYESILKELADYAKSKGVKLLLWYGVNNTCHPTYPENSLLDDETIKKELEWTASIGFSGVKVDFFDSDAQKEMKIMKSVAETAANNKLVVVFHGCTIPHGEIRTYPNILSYEAIKGIENAKWDMSSIYPENIISQMLIRNAVGPSDFTPTGMAISSTDDGFGLATLIGFNSGVTSYARSVASYEGYSGMNFIDSLPDKWDKSIILEGEPGQYASFARNGNGMWYIGSVSATDRNVDLSLDFLGSGNYTMYMWQSEEKGLVMKKSSVTLTDHIKVSLKYGQGFVAIITDKEIDLSTPYDSFTFYEGEDYGANPYPLKRYDMYCSGEIALGINCTSNQNGMSVEYKADKSGVYDICVYGRGEGDMCINVNGKNQVNFSFDEGVKIIKKYTFKLNLQKGNNTIEIYCDNDSKVYNADIDKIAIGPDKLNESNVLTIVSIAIIILLTIAGATAVIIAIKRKETADADDSSGAVGATHDASVDSPSYSAADAETDAPDTDTPDNK